MPLAGGGSSEAGGGTLLRLRGWEGVVDVLAYYCSYGFLELERERGGRRQIWRVTCVDVSVIAVATATELA
jgi:hypothetical protein